MKIANITREKQAPTPGKNYRFAWRWIYTIDFGEVVAEVGQRTATHDTLSSAKASCKRLGFKPVEAWKVTKIDNRETIDMKIKADKKCECENGRIINPGDEVEYMGHVPGGMVKVKFSDGATDIAHPHAFKCFR